VVEVFFQLASKWLKWCAQSLHPFSQILKISLRIGAPIVAPPSDNFQMYFIIWKGFFFPYWRLNCSKETTDATAESSSMSHEADIADCKTTNIMNYDFNQTFHKNHR